MAGTTFMLSGSLTGWAGWAVTGPLVWAGWLVAGALMCWRPGRWQMTGVVVLALSGAFAMYGGFPETLVLASIALGALVLIGGALAARRRQLRPGAVARSVGGLAGGAALSAPLWLPGLAVLRQSARFTQNATGGLALRGLALLFAQGYDGLPTTGSTWTGPANYYEATAYVGIIALVLALFALLVAWRRPMVVALGGTGALCLVIIYGAPTQRLFTTLGGGDIATQRMLPMLAFCIAVLAGLGTEALRRRWHEAGTQRRLLASLVACGGVLVYLLLISDSTGVTGAELSARRLALLWPLLIVLGAAGVLGLAIRAQSRARRQSGSTRGALIPAACLLLLAAQSAYLVFAGVGLNSYSSRPYPVDSSVAMLKRLVGNGLVALDGPNTKDVTQWTGTGIYPEVNLGYGIRELAVHDPVLPPSYLRTWPVAAATVNDHLGDNVFVPSVGTARRARFYGAQFILASPGRQPKGAVFVAKIPAALVRYVFLYRVPGASQFSFEDGPGHGARAAPHDSAQVLAQAQPDNGMWRLAVRVPITSALTVRVTYLPGWHVLADGRALAVHEVDGLFVGATVPAGTRTIVVRYWPGGLSAGSALALAALGVLVLASSAEGAVRRERRTQALAPPPAPVHTGPWWRRLLGRWFSPTSGVSTGT
jgi:hypothetical protein